MQATKKAAWDNRLDERLEGISRMVAKRLVDPKAEPWTARINLLIEVAKDLLGPKYLPDGLHYHDINHTMEVYGAARTYGAMEKLGGREHELLMAAALLHDTGYLVKYDGNEPDGAAIAKRVLRKLGWYSDEEIGIVERLILATSMPQQPTTLLEKIICDSDLTSLGSDDYEKRSSLLRMEWGAWKGMKFSDLEWHRRQIEFLSMHKYFTDSARNGMAGKRQEKNLEEEKGKLESAEKAELRK